MTRYLVTGAGGRLGAYLLDALAREGAEVVAWGRRLDPVDLADLDALPAHFRAARPDCVLHAAARSAVADCLADPPLARLVNTLATARLAGLCADAGVRLVFLSTDLVFDGTAAPYAEGDPPCPLSVYGQTKRDGELAALTCPGAVVARLSLLFGPSLTDVPTFFDHQLRAIEAGRPIALFSDEWRTPLDLPSAARALLVLAASSEAGIFHLGGPERMSRLEMGQRLALFLGRGEDGILPSLREDAPQPEPRPRDTSLASEKVRSTFPALVFPRYEDALRAMLGA